MILKDIIADLQRLDENKNRLTVRELRDHIEEISKNLKEIADKLFI